jgi:hypothetical protein
MMSAGSASGFAATRRPKPGCRTGNSHTDRLARQATPAADAACRCWMGLPTVVTALPAVATSREQGLRHRDQHHAGATAGAAAELGAAQAEFVAQHGQRRRGAVGVDGNRAAVDDKLSLRSRPPHSQQPIARP